MSRQERLKNRLESLGGMFGLHFGAEVIDENILIYEMGADLKMEEQFIGDIDDCEIFIEGLSKGLQKVI